MENSPPHSKTAPPQTSEFAKLDEIFGDHLILDGKKLWISDFGQNITLNFGEDLFFFFFFGGHLILGGKKLWISELSETFRLKFRTNRLKLIQDQWKFESRSFAHFSLFQNSPPPLFQILATRLVRLQRWLQKKYRPTDHTVEFGYIDFGYIDSSSPTSVLLCWSRRSFYHLRAFQFAYTNFAHMATSFINWPFPLSPLRCRYDDIWTNSTAILNFSMNK